MKGIVINNLSFQYRKGVKVFNNFNIILESVENRGHVIAIMGSSGSGKSTFLKLLLGIEKPQTGTINLFPSNPVISYVPQEPVLFEHLTIKDNAEYFKFAGAYKKRFNEETYYELITDLGLAEVIEKGKSVTEISGGQKQRLSLLRALSINPDLLLLDEPCNGLDAEVKRSFLNKLREITEHYGLFVLYITHHKLEAQMIADEVVYLKQNKATGSIDSPVKGSILEFIKRPPVLDAAYVFHFPNVKILPIIKRTEEKVEIAYKEDDITGYLLLNEENITVNKDKGMPFRVISKSPVFTVIKHIQSGVEWMLGADLLEEYCPGDEIQITLEGNYIKYDKKGLIEIEIKQQNNY